ncbi:hypothetical protein L227DRAFT_290487 [Lentinus tigrinus ALCF2SS1-6]|uniref:Uncharacterized protein n=1 Tax=Lentinus tigrinus ALCF2SS1-6 TaxID=1328759 RepID=A0A5C2RYD8_9APHY|nr:hypothetical protein L227DRAFT_290487 [Lentinus tigrinus ALCF2SS1-6]
MPASRSSRSSGSTVRASSSRRHRPGFWDVVSSTIRGLFSQNAPRRPTERPATIEEESTPSTLEITPPIIPHANLPPQAPANQQPVIPPPPAPSAPPRVHALRHGHGTDARATCPRCPRRVPEEQVPAVPAAPPTRPCRRVPLQRHGAFHERDRPYWNPGSGYEPPVVYGRNPATLPENQVWDPLWGPVPRLSVIAALSNGPPTPQQVIDYLNLRFRLNRRAYSMALDILFPQPREAPVERGIPVYQRVLETSRWRRDHPDWEGGIVPIDREVGPARADDAADSQAGSDDEEDSNDGALTPRERRAVRTRVERQLPDAYRALVAAEHTSGTVSDPAAAASSTPAAISGASSSSPASTFTSSSSGTSSSSDSSSEDSSSSSSQEPSSPSPRKRSRNEDGDGDADSDFTLCEDTRPSTRQRLDADPPAPIVPASSSPTSAAGRRLRSGADTDERRARRELMRQNRHLLPPIGPPGVRIGAPSPASTSQRGTSTSRVVDSGPGHAAHVPAQPVAGSSRPRRGLAVHVEVPSLRESRKRSRNEGTAETGASHQDGEGRDGDGKRKKRSKKD